MSVVEIEAMDRAGLVAAWSEVFSTPVPKGLSRTLMRRFLAIEVQSRQFGGALKEDKSRASQSGDGRFKSAHRLFVVVIK